MLYFHDTLRAAWMGFGGLDVLALFAITITKRSADRNGNRSWECSSPSRYSDPVSRDLAR